MDATLKTLGYGLGNGASNVGWHVIEVGTCLVLLIAWYTKRGVDPAQKTVVLPEDDLEAQSIETETALQAMLPRFYTGMLLTSSVTDSPVRR